MKQERVAEDELWAAVRSSGLSDLYHVKAIVLETDGSFSIVKK